MSLIKLTECVTVAFLNLGVSTKVAEECTLPGHDLRRCHTRDQGINCASVFLL